MSFHANSIESVVNIFHSGVQQLSQHLNRGRFLRGEAQYVHFVYGGCVLFALLLLLKGLYDFCRILFVPLIIVFCLYGIFIHADGVVRHQVIKMEKRKTTVLKTELLYISFCLLVVHNLFGDTMYNLRSTFDFISLRKFSNSIQFIEVIWLLIKADITIKLLAVSIKILIVLIPGCYLEFQKRGILYYFVEHNLRFLKCIVSTQPWLYYFYQSYSGFETLLALVMCVCYLFFKIPGVVLNYRNLKSSMKKLIELLHNVDFTVPNESSNTDCPICFSKCLNPLTLRCKHTFCKYCFLRWFSDNKTCPLCRDKVNYPIENYHFDNGGTAYFVQII